MRFPQIPIGQRFTYQGKHYTKTGPLSASEEITGNQRMIPKAAEVVLLDGAGKPVTEVKQRYSRAEVVRLLERFKADLIGDLQALAAAEGSLPLDRVIELIRTREADG